LNFQIVENEIYIYFPQLQKIDFNSQIHVPNLPSTVQSVEFHHIPVTTRNLRTDITHKQPHFYPKKYKLLPFKTTNIRELNILL